MGVSQGTSALSSDKQCDTQAEFMSSSCGFSMVPKAIGGKCVTPSHRVACVQKYSVHHGSKP